MKLTCCLLTPGLKILKNRLSCPTYAKIWFWVKSTTFQMSEIYSQLSCQTQGIPLAFRCCSKRLCQPTSVVLLTYCWKESICIKWILSLSLHFLHKDKEQEKKKKKALIILEFPYCLKRAKWHSMWQQHDIVIGTITVYNLYVSVMPSVFCRALL